MGNLSFQGFFKKRLCNYRNSWTRGIWTWIFSTTQFQMIFTFKRSWISCCLLGCNWTQMRLGIFGPIKRERPKGKITSRDWSPCLFDISHLVILGPWTKISFPLLWLYLISSILKISIVSSSRVVWQGLWEQTLSFSQACLQWLRFDGFQRQRR